MKSKPHRVAIRDRSVFQNCWSPMIGPTEKRNGEEKTWGNRWMGYLLEKDRPLCFFSEQLILRLWRWWCNDSLNLSRTRRPYTRDWALIIYPVNLNHGKFLLFHLSVSSMWFVLRIGPNSSLEYVIKSTACHQVNSFFPLQFTMASILTWWRKVWLEFNLSQLMSNWWLYVFFFLASFDSSCWNVECFAWEEGDK
jgi:hypothetical protein